MIVVHNEIKNDYAKYCHDKLRNVFPSYVLSDETIDDYHRYKFRIIKENQRNVFVSNKIRLKSKHQQSFNEICSCIENGNPLLKYQSRLLKDYTYNDPMLMDWGIHHFHLGGTIETDGFVKRTKELLFVRFTESSAYIIGVFSHGDWSDTTILEIIHEEWPESISTFKTNALDLLFNPSSKDVGKLRNAGINTPIKLRDGTIYMGPGMGLTSIGTPSIVTMNIIKIYKQFDSDFNYINNNIEKLLELNEIEYKQDMITVGVDLVQRPGKFQYLLKEINLGLVLDEIHL